MKVFVNVFCLIEDLILELPRIAMAVRACRDLVEDGRAGAEYCEMPLPTEVRRIRKLPTREISSRTACESTSLMSEGWVTRVTPDDSAISLVSGTFWWSRPLISQISPAKRETRVTH